MRGFLLALGAVLAPVAAAAQMMMTGAGGAGSAIYIPQAVFLSDYNGYIATPGAGTASPTQLQVSGVNVPDTAHMTVSFWARFTPMNDTGTDQASVTSSRSFFMGSASCQGSCTAENAPGWNFTPDNQSAPPLGSLRLNFIDSTGLATAHACDVTVVPATFKAAIDAQWHHFLISFDGTPVSNTKSVAVYMDGASIASNCTYTFSTGTMLIGIAEQDGYAIKGSLSSVFSLNGGPIELADVFQDLASSIVCNDGATAITPVGGGPSYSCTGLAKGTIPPALVAKFYNNGPVNLGANGSTPLGRQPEIWYTGGPAGWAANAGQATNLTQVGSIYSAPTGPGNTAPAHKAWVRFADIGPLGSAKATYTVVETQAGAIQQNDLILVGVTITDSAVTTTHAPVCPTGGGWTQTLYQNEVATNLKHATFICQKIAGASETGSYAITWTGNNTRGGTAWIIDVAGVNTTTPVEVSAIAASGTGAGTTSCVAPSVSPTNTNDTLLAVYATYLGTDFITPPAGETPVLAGTEVTPMSSLAAYSILGGSGAASTLVGQEFLSASAATGTRTATITSDSCAAALLAIQPN